MGYGAVVEDAHVPALLESGEFDVVGVADPAEARLAKAERDLGLGEQHLYSNPSAVIGRDDVDVVLAAVPPAHRPSIVKAALGAGKHVVAEKPLAIAPAEAWAMVRAAEGADRCLAMVHNYLFFPEVQDAQRLVGSGAIGIVRQVIVSMLGVEEDPDDTGWRRRLATSGGGVLMDMLHAMYLASELTGEAFIRCTAVADSYSRGDVEEIAICLMEGPSTLSSVAVGWGYGPGGIDIVGTGGRISIRYESNGTPPFSPFERLTVTTGDRSWSPHVAARSISDSFVDLWADFARALERGDRPRATGTDGAGTLEAVVAAYASSVRGSGVVLPLDEASPLMRGAAGIEGMGEPISRAGLRGLFSAGGAARE